MAKWKSVIVQKEVKNPDGSAATQGVTAWLPENDAAKADPRVEKAIQLGKYVPSVPDEQKVMAQKMKDRLKDELKRQGKLPRDAR